MKLVHEQGAYTHWCPACEIMHLIPIGEPYKTRWEFNSDHDAPTFTPSVRHQWGSGTCCHYNITAGVIQFHHDSTHGLAGKTVELPPLPSL